MSRRDWCLGFRWLGGLSVFCSRYIRACRSRLGIINLLHHSPLCIDADESVVTLLRYNTVCRCSAPEYLFYRGLQVEAKEGDASQV
jgi:hypothetical protein